MELLTILVIIYLYCTDASVGEHITLICFFHYFFRLLIKVDMFVDQKMGESNKHAKNMASACEEVK